MIGAAAFTHPDLRRLLIAIMKGAAAFATFKHRNLHR